MTLAAAEALRWEARPEVWLLVAGTVGLYVYALRVIGPKVVPAGTPTSTRVQRVWFGIGIVVLWAAADWPIHDIGEEALYSVHMVQHLLLTFVVPPALLLATPEWLARLILGGPSTPGWLRRLARPIPSFLAFNSLALISHWQAFVNLSVRNGTFHYVAHVAFVLTALLLWLPICGPLEELRLSPPAAMIYLFLTSIIPTVPSGWLTFAEGTVYRAYDNGDRLWGVTVTSDQQLAGALMKVLGGGFLWVVIAVIFIRWASEPTPARRDGRPPVATASPSAGGRRTPVPVGGRSVASVDSSRRFSGEGDGAEASVADDHEGRNRPR